MATTTRAKTNGHGNGKAPQVLSRALRPNQLRPAKPQLMRWTHEQYHEMAELGWFAEKRVELIGGEIIEMAPMLSSHWISVGLTGEKMREVFTQGYIVTVQLPIKLPHISEPEPDIAVVRGTWRDYKEGLPQTALLIVEISDATLRYDRTVKASLYAAAGIAEYWIVNQKARQLEVLRAPQESAKAKFGWVYQEKTELKESDTVSPLAAPDATIQVADLLP